MKNRLLHFVHSILIILVQPSFQAQTAQKRKKKKNRLYFALSALKEVKGGCKMKSPQKSPGVQKSPSSKKTKRKGSVVFIHLLKCSNGLPPYLLDAGIGSRIFDAKTYVKSSSSLLPRAILTKVIPCISRHDYRRVIVGTDGRSSSHRSNRECRPVSVYRCRESIRRHW